MTATDLQLDRTAEDANWLRANRKALHVGFTGTGLGMTTEQQNAVRLELLNLRLAFGMDKPAWLHQGDCVGADAQATYVAMELGYQIHGHPPTNARARAYTHMDEQAPRLPYMQRNQAIVDASVVLVAAVPGPEHKYPRSGTWATVRRARKARLRLAICWPDGAVTDNAVGL